jgi:hypothetical protein
MRNALGLGAMALLLAGCGMFGRDATETRSAREIADTEIYRDEPVPQSTVWDIFVRRGDPDEIGAVNRYIWNAALETLSFLPVDSVDPFTGVITTGYGVPPGGGQPYRATVYVTDPALDARALNVAIQTRTGPASAATIRAVEDAILTRARQLRQRAAGY